MKAASPPYQPAPTRLQQPPVRVSEVTQAIIGYVAHHELFDTPSPGSTLLCGTVVLSLQLSSRSATQCRCLGLGSSRFADRSHLSQSGREPLSHIPRTPRHSQRSRMRAPKKLWPSTFLPSPPYAARPVFPQTPCQGRAPRIPARSTSQRHSGTEPLAASLSRFSRPVNR